MKRRGFFITGTDTGVGKTICAGHLIRRLIEQHWRVAAMKPIASGARWHADGLRNDDALQLQAAANVKLPYTTLNPYCFEPAVSPHLAAEDSSTPLDIAHVHRVLQSIDADVVVVEGAGGWLAPLSPQESMADLARVLELPVILVVGMRLGCLNHAALTCDAIAASALPFAGWIANRMDPHMLYADRNQAFLSDRIDAPLLATVPFSDERRHSIKWSDEVLLQHLRR